MNLDWFSFVLGMVVMYDVFCFGYVAYKKFEKRIRGRR